MRKGSFQAQLSAFGDKTMDRTTRLHRGVAVTLFNAVILDTPVDTGRLAANWRTSKNEPERTADERKSPGLAQAEVTANTADSAPTDTLILTNSLPYAYRIEYEGWSKRKAPQGMVQRNIRRFKSILKDQLVAARYRK